MTGKLEQIDGKLEEAGGRWRLRFTRELTHPQQKVWRAITEPEHLRAWYPQHITGRWEVGAELTFSDPEGRGPEFTGEVLAYSPPSVLAFSWGTDELRIELEPSDDGCTLTLTDTFGELGKAARDAAGWHACLDLLASHLDGGGGPQDVGERWAEVHPRYVEAFGPEAAAIGPPAEYS